MKGYNFLKSRNTKKVFDLGVVNLPPMYLLFLETFEIHSFRNTHFLDKDKELSQLGVLSFTLNDDVIHLDSFLDIEMIKDTFSNASLDEEWSQYKLIRIAYLGQAGFGGLYVGCSNDNLDEIWVFNSDLDCKYQKVSNNIFEFFKMLYLDDDYSDYDNDYSKLYKNWGEDFWRVKEVVR